MLPDVTLLVNQNHIRTGDVNPLTTNVPHHIEISQLIWITNQLTGFYVIVV